MTTEEKDIEEFDCEIEEYKCDKQAAYSCWKCAKPMCIECCVQDFSHQLCDECAMSWRIAGWQRKTISVLSSMEYASTYQINRFTYEEMALYRRTFVSLMFEIQYPERAA